MQHFGAFEVCTTGCVEDWIKVHFQNQADRRSGHSSVAKFLLLGRGARFPNVPTGKKSCTCICNLYARASEASERFRNINIFRSPNYICIHIQSMQWYGTINDSMTDKTLTLRKVYEYASELRKCLHLLILKLLFHSIFCWYFVGTLSQKHIFSGLHLHLHT